jgi:fermentation-respiration switch protein FrsA (DUF1100 family)
MATNVLMPKWGMSMREGLVNSWLKKEGDRVEQGEALVEVESEKATNFIEAPASGILARVLVPDGQTVPITTVLAVITAPGEAVPEPVDASPAKAASPAGVPEVSHAPAPSRDRPRVAASPAARRLAREQKVDLTLLKGTGPDGLIVVEDVEAVLQAPPRASTVPVSRVSFYSQGHKLDGILYLPKNHEANQRLPGIVFCLGYTYLKDFLVPEMAKRLGAQGYACLVFDYRGFGKSEGPRGRLLPLEQVADIRSAITFLTAQPNVDANRIGLVGISLGGSHALYTAGTDERVQAVAAVAPMGEGRRWLRGGRRYWEWVEFLGKVEADRTARVLGGKGEQVDAWEIVSPDPASRAFLAAMLRDFPAMRCELSLETAEALLAYSPESVVGRIAPRPVLLLHGEADLLVPADESRSLFGRAAEPRRLVIVPGMGHFDWAVPQDQRFARVLEVVGRWLEDHLGSRSGQDENRETSPKPLPER